MIANGDDPAKARAIEYIDSPLMTQRLVYRKELSVRIEGNYGIYHTTVRVGRKLIASCTCPADFRPCKHIHAVRATWDKNPASFFDLERFLKELATMPKDTLVDMLANIFQAYPESLAVLGVPGFEVDREAEDYE